MPARSFVDTNVLVYAIDQAEPAKRDRARELLAEPAAASSLVISTQVLCEFYVVATRRLERPLALEDATTAVSELSKLHVVGADVALVRSGVRISREATVSLWDALIVAAAQAGDCERILTEDLSDGARIEGVAIDNPFRDL